MLREGQARGLGQAAGYVWECGESFYGTMAGPWWYHTATSVPRLRNLPFSLLRMLMQATLMGPSSHPQATSEPK